MAITCIEDMSNELFFEIFDYLDGCDVTNVFFNLNIRFRCLIKTSPLLFKIKLCPDGKPKVRGIRQQVMLPYKNQILSLYLSDYLIINRFFNLYPISSSFERIESVNLQFVRKDQLVLLGNLNLLTRLFRLIIHFEGDEIDLIDVYSLTINLPVLKYNKISIPFANSITLSSNIIPNQSNSIEYLVIDHPCRIDDFSRLLPYTPQLRRLSFKKSLNPSFQTNFSLILSNLTHLYINKCTVGFDQFEIFIRIISSKLQVLKLFTFDHSSYLDANRWERLISQHMPQLRKFYFQHHELFNSNYLLTPHHQLINQFTSPFWIDRQWIFDVIVDLREITYSIQPYRKRWFEFDKLENHDYHFTPDNNQTDIINPSIPSCKNVQLTVTCHFIQTYSALLLNTTNSILSTVKITCLDIDCSKILITTLIKVIDLLPDLDSLRISYLPLPETRCFIQQKLKDTPVLNENKKITKVNLEHMFRFEQIQFLIGLCPCIQYLIINCINNVNLISYIRSILRSFKYLILLTLNISAVTDTIIEKIQTVINDEYHDFSRIERMNNQIVLRRNLQ